MHVSPDLPRARRALIAEHLRAGQPVVAAALAEEFGVSEDSIRRDLRALAQEGLCQRVYGGALPLSPASTPIDVRLGEEAARKHALARRAVDLIRPDQTLFLDAGSTLVPLAGLLPEGQGLRVVTNSIPAAAALLGRSGIALVLIGGGVNMTVGGAVDAQALSELARLRIDLCFLGACALSPEEGLAGFEMDDVAFKRRLLQQSRASVLMMTNGKLGTQAPFAIARADEIGHYILEADAPEEMELRVRRTGATVLRAAPPA
ncbi:DeoR/GlpR transcriptional regulator [Cereibacter sphaeroides]|uniref:DeoR/GlpR family DNA-binding transcription regulator n=1 Tax=Cereibacter sphaeroides TaxID=1063 RepID=UPI000E5B1294|nr:DeoR/GlpR family DNA-binding transcription regulator [Cereibacter sphaeroides]RHZ99023.1 DeoR/GlpR transcriptional regulator [Cereibacter sphaeroides]